MSQVSREFAGAHVVVIGAGVIGSVLAYRIAQAGAKVTVLESNYPGGGTSGGSFAWVNTFNKNPLSYFRLNARSIREHADLQHELGGNWLHTTGGWHWSDQEGATYTGDLDATIRDLRQRGSRVEEYTPGQVGTVEPSLRVPESVERVYLVRGEGWVQTQVMISSLLLAARQQYGATIRRQAAAGFTLNGGAMERVVLDDGDEITADVAIVAAGPRSGALAAELGTTLSLELTHGVFAVTGPAPPSLGRVVVGPKLIARPDGGGRLLLGMEEMLSLPETELPTMDSPAVHEVLDRGVQVFPELAGVPIESLRYGVRVVPQDGHPVIGWDPTVSGVYYAVTHSGVTLSAALGSLIVDDLLTSNNEYLTDYRLDRFAGPPPSPTAAGHAQSSQ